MIAIGVTGGLGSGKSTVVRLLEARGAVPIDADRLARGALGRGTPPFDATVARFGPEILDGDGRIDRTQLAALVFSDERARRDLEAIVHPVVHRAIQERLAELASTEVVVLDLPLLVETGGRARYQLDGVLVVDTPTDLAIKRVERDRGLDPRDAAARVAAQIDPAERLRAADFIIMNHGSLDELEEMVDRAWTWIGRIAVERGDR